MPRQRPDGFTLIEMLLSLAVVSVLFGVSLPVSRAMLQKNDLDLTVSSVTELLNRARIRARAVDGDTGWGVFIAGGSATLFRGQSFAQRIAGTDEVTAFPAEVTAGGMQEFDFSKFTGELQATGSVTLSSPDDTVTISVNAKGTVNR